jgi:hypothetical protein
VAAALVKSPAAGEGIDDVESPSADAVEVVLANGALEPVALVDHLDQQTVLVKLGAELDHAPTMHERVRDQLGDEQLGGMASGDVQVRFDPFSQPLAR